MRASLEDKTFVRLTLSRRREAGELRNVYGRVVHLKAGPAVSFTLRYPTRDVTRNEPFGDAQKTVLKWIDEEFEEGRLFTTTGDWRLRAPADGEGSLKASRPTFSIAPPPVHDRSRVRAVVGAPFLVKLGVTSPDGQARPGMADKLRQVERFTEILGHLTDDCGLRDAKAVTVCDMGAGKGYLTFAIHEFFRARAVEAQVIGVEQREELVAQANAAASELGCTGLRFERGAIADFALPERLDVLIALHACDTATDDALAAGVRACAQLLVTAPCCHKELRPQMSPPPVLAGILRHGILAERQAELLTDGLRAQVLEAAGYDARVFEFISNEHTAKNLMLAATRQREAGDPAAVKEGVRAVMEFFGLRTQRLAKLLR